MLDARGIETRYTYDALNRPTSRRYPADPGRDVTLAYDQNSNGKGHLTQLTDESGTTRFTYHRRGLLIGQDSNGLNVGYGYNASDNLSSIRYPSGRLVQYVRGGPNEAIGQINLNVQGTVTPLVSGIGYRGDGPRAAWTYGNGLKLQRSYDTDTRLLKQTLSTLQGLAWSYNSVDQLTVWTDLLDSVRTQRFSYDALDRLTQASGPYATQGFSYDANGNRLREQSGNSVTTYAYAPGSQRLSSRSGSVNETRSYDAAGHPTGVRGLPTTYSVSGRLAQAGSTEYRYNGFGQRVYKNVNGTITRYVYDAAGHLLAEADASGQSTREYVWLDEQPIAVLTPTTPGATTVRIDYIVPDHLGTPRLIIDSAGAVVWRWDSDPFGSTAPNEDPAGTGTRYVFNLRFPGQYFDAETGLSYNYMRMYEPGTGRYLESDPVGLAGGVNTYAYVGNNPLARTDPTGEFWWFALAGIGGAATEGVAAGGVSWATTALAGLGLGAMMGIAGDTPKNSGEESGQPEISNIEKGGGSGDPCQLFPETCPSQNSDGLVPGRPEVPNGSQLVRRDVRAVKSAEFKDYCYRNDLPGKNWTYVMETWRTPDGRMVERHYWSHPSGSAFWHK